MHKYLILCLCVSLNGVLCDLNKKEGVPCEWNGVRGRCVQETRCLTTLNKQGEQHPICSRQDDVNIVCCTDCELVNSTRNAVTSFGFYWKDGTKARDHCLQYLEELPYRCREGGYSSGISMIYDEEKECHTFGLWSIGGAVPQRSTSAFFPQHAQLGFGEDLATVIWTPGGSIISNKYILTIANLHNTIKTNGNLNFVLLGVREHSGHTNPWQTHKVKRVILHPDYKMPSLYHNIALVETESLILFNKDILPACLPVEAANDETAITWEWGGLDFRNYADTVQSITVYKVSVEDCQDAYNALPAVLENGIDFRTQMCYGIESLAFETRDIVFLPGVPLLIDTQFSGCSYTIIGLRSFHEICGRDFCKPDIVTKVAHYKPWIESVVWP